MPGAIAVLIGLIMLGATAGCSGQRVTRVASRLEEVPRVDLDLSSGNRGYLVGRPASDPELKTTRQMIQTDIELPSFYRAKPSGSPVDLGPLEAGASDAGGAADPAAGVAPVDSYVVQKGDSLWTIAQKPEIYGNGNAWRRIFNANRGLLKRGADSVRAGMTLRIPRGDEGVDDVLSDHGDEDEGLRFKK